VLSFEKDEIYRIPNLYEREDRIADALTCICGTETVKFGC